MQLFPKEMYVNYKLKNNCAWNSSKACVCVCKFKWLNHCTADIFHLFFTLALYWSMLNFFTRILDSFLHLVVQHGFCLFHDLNSTCLPNTKSWKGGTTMILNMQWKNIIISLGHPYLIIVNPNNFNYVDYIACWCQYHNQSLCIVN